MPYALLTRKCLVTAERERDAYNCNTIPYNKTNELLIFLISSQTFLLKSVLKRLSWKHFHFRKYIKSAYAIVMQRVVLYEKLILFTLAHTKSPIFRLLKLSMFYKSHPLNFLHDFYSMI